MSDDGMGTDLEGEEAEEDEEEGQQARALPQWERGSGIRCRGRRRRGGGGGGRHGRGVEWLDVDRVKHAAGP